MDSVAEELGCAFEGRGDREVLQYNPVTGALVTERERRPPRRLRYNAVTVSGESS